MVVTEIAATTVPVAIAPAATVIAGDWRIATDQAGAPATTGGLAGILLLGALTGAGIAAQTLRPGRRPGRG